MCESEGVGDGGDGSGVRLRVFLLSGLNKGDNFFCLYYYSL